MSTLYRIGRLVSVAVCALAIFVPVVAAAQSAADLAQLRKLYGDQGGASQQGSQVDAGRAAAAEAAQRQSAQLQSLAEQSVSQQSALEQDYSERAGTALKQFGYNVFSYGIGAAVNGALSDDYRLGIGDEIVLTLHGQTSKTMSARVDREGRLIVPDLRPVSAAGRSFGEVREELEARVANSMIGTDVFVSVGAVRMVSIIVAGEVQRPGLQQLTGLSTLVDALYAAGGVRKTGTLRHILLQRHGKTTVFDAYRILTGESSAVAPTIQAGDRIIVPPIGKTMAITGAVKRVGIFELSSDKPESVAQLLKWAGGTIRPKGNRYLLTAWDDTGRQDISELKQPRGVAGHDGDVLQVQTSDGVSAGSVQLLGHVRVPGMRALGSAPTIRALVGDVDSLDPDPYLLFAVLLTVDTQTYSTRMVAVNLEDVLDGKIDYPLKDRDRLVVFSKSDIQYLLSGDVQGVLARKELVAKSTESQAEMGKTSAGTVRGAVAGAELCGGLRELSRILVSERLGRFANAILSVRGDAGDVVTYSGNCPVVFDHYPQLLPFLLENVVVLRGEVRQPGAFPIVKATSLGSLMAFAGDSSREADLSNVELSQTVMDPDAKRTVVVRKKLNIAADHGRSFLVNPGDVVRFNSVDSDRESGAVLLVGEFRHPGYYDLSRGEQLSDVITRAGGLTEQAYPYGAVFSRDRIKRQERDNYRRAARDLQDAMLGIMARKGSSGDSAAAGAVNSLVNQLTEIEPVGRIVVEADPLVLSVRPELDTLMEPGDTVYMPKRTNVVTVSGEVLNPGAMSFIPGDDASDYLRRAGGIRSFGDEDRVFVIQPNGSAQPLQTAAWNFDPVQIPPGSTIVVPRDPAPFDLMAFSRDIAGLFADLAITGASLATISRN